MGADPGLFHLNPDTFLSGDGRLSCRPIGDPRDLRPNKKPILFIHGAEYGNPSEVLHQMILPFFAGSGLSPQVITSTYDVYFLSWHSDLICKKKHSAQEVATLRKSVILDFLRGGRRLPVFWEDVERRARMTAAYLEPFWLQMIEHSSPYLPEIVTHSLGSYLYSELIQNLAIQRELPKNLGSWLSLQPAVTCNAYQPGGRFDLVPHIYNHAGSRKEVWLSRFDMVLGILYPMATRNVSLKPGNLPESWYVKDLSWSIREAHGSVSLSPYLSNFFSRVATSLQDRYAPGSLHVANAHNF